MQWFYLNKELNYKDSKYFECSKPIDPFVFMSKYNWRKLADNSIVIDCTENEVYSKISKD